MVLSSMRVAVQSIMSKGINTMLLLTVSILSPVGFNTNLTAPVAAEQILRKLQPASMDASNRSTCLEGTRTQVLQYITDWASRPSPDQRILWLHGLVGSGKSTISKTVEPKD